MLQTKRSLTSTSTEMSSRNPNPLRSNQSTIKRRSHWTMIFLRNLWSQRRSNKNWLALSRQLEMHGSRRPKEVTETVLTGWQSLHNWLSKMRNSIVWFQSMPQLGFPMITRMESIGSHSNQQPSRCSLTNGILRWKTSYMQLVSIKCSEISWSFQKGARLCQVTGYTTSSAMEQAKYSDSRPG